MSEMVHAFALLAVIILPKGLVFGYIRIQEL